MEDTLIDFLNRFWVFETSKESQVTSFVLYPSFGYLVWWAPTVCSLLHPRKRSGYSQQNSVCFFDNNNNNNKNIFVVGLWWKEINDNSSFPFFVGALSSPSEKKNWSKILVGFDHIFFMSPILVHILYVASASSDVYSLTFVFVLSNCQTGCFGCTLCLLIIVSQHVLFAGWSNPALTHGIYSFGTDLLECGWIGS